MACRMLSTYGTALVLSIAATIAQGATVQYQLSDCNDSAVCSPQFGNNFGVVTVTDVAGFFFFLGLATLAVRWAGGG